MKCIKRNVCYGSPREKRRNDGDAVHTIARQTKRNTKSVLFMPDVWLHCVKGMIFKFGKVFQKDVQIISACPAREGKHSRPFVETRHLCVAALPCVAAQPGIVSCEKGANESALKKISSHGARLDAAEFHEMRGALPGAPGRDHGRPPVWTPRRVSARGVLVNCSFLSLPVCPLCSSGTLANVLCCLCLLLSAAKASHLARAHLVRLLPPVSLVPCTTFECSRFVSARSPCHRLLSEIFEWTPTEDLDGLVRVVVPPLMQTRRILPFLKTLIAAEVAKTSTESTKCSTLRGNTATTKLETAYTSMLASASVCGRRT